jgi:hypothetical protein
MLELRATDNTVLAGTHGRGFYYTTFDYNPTTGIPDNFAGKVLIYPNPAKEMVEVLIPELSSGNIRWELTGLNGALISTGQKTRGEEILRIGLGNLDPGTYIIRIKSDNHAIAKKFIKI